eukprot:scaffold98597_cov30-Phaeocystis_antarctica.AAC.1
MAGTNLEFPNGNIEGAGGAGPLVVGALPKSLDAAPSHPGGSHLAAPRRFGSHATFLGCSPPFASFPSASRRSSRAARPPFVYEACAELPVRNSRAQLRSQRSASASASSW